VPENITAKEKKYHYYIRKYASSFQPSKEEREELISLSRRTPFDDQINTQASVYDISPLLVQEFLQNVDSALVDQIDANTPIKEIYRALEESIANALYHRSWDMREPVEIRILPDCIEIINQGGPDRSVNPTCDLKIKT